MDEYIKLKTKLQLGKNSDIKYINAKDVDDLRSIDVDSNQSKMDRMLDFLNTVKNPYVFTVDGIKVKFEYAVEGPNINECIENLLKNKNI